VLIIDKRNHIGGNAYDRLSQDGLLIHQYGPHIFHTNSPQIFDYLSKFTGWRPYEHRVLAHVEGKLLPIPINLDTINGLYDLSLDSAGLERFFAERAETPDEIRTSEDVVVSRVGRDIYEKFFRGYTRKQWGLDPSELDKSVIARIPVRFDRDPRYFSDSYQFMPIEGYTRMFKRMLAHDKITVKLETNWKDVRREGLAKRIIFTGPVDEFFDYEFGPLPYRSLRFEHVTLDEEWNQPVAVVNYPQTEAYTRVTEYKHLTGQRHPKTALTYEFPSATGDPYYPIPNASAGALYRKYEAAALDEANVWFVGRLATYRYYNMDQVVGQALATFRRIAALQGGAVAGTARPALVERPDL
jgi:UDP-galactopyranose mutase